MSLKKTEAFVLKSFNWSESSRTVSFFTRDQGKLALNDRGGRSLKAKRGRALPFAHLELTYYTSEKPTPGYVTEIHAQKVWSFEDDAALGRLALAGAACELLWLVLPDHEPHPEIFNYYLTYFDRMNSAPRESLPATFLVCVLRTLSFVGYQPLLTGCVGCGKSLEKISTAELRFSPDRGGIICGACQVSGERYIQLASDDLKVAVALQSSSLKESGAHKVSFAQMNRMTDVLIEFLRAQTGIQKINSLEFLEKLKVAGTDLQLSSASKSQSGAQ